MRNFVSITEANYYPLATPFHPDTKFIEYRYQQISSEINQIYRSFRDNLHQLGLDEANFGKSNWNPLGAFIHPGNTVVIKPNLVRHFHGLGLGLESLITHGSLVRAILDYVIIALEDKGHVIIGDSPLQQGDIEQVTMAAGINEIIDYLRSQTKIQFEIIDFRRERAEKDKEGRVAKRIKLAGDPRGYFAVNLGRDSELVAIEKDFEKFRVTQYDPKEMPKHHHVGRHEYLIPASVLKADVFINVPKLKTHRKAGITASLKNLVGINGSKDWLPHHRAGSVEIGGDEYLKDDPRKHLMRLLVEKIDTVQNYQLVRLLSFLRKLIDYSRHLIPFKDQYFEGSWYGNDTLPRTITDLNKIILYADKGGRLQPKQQRQYLTVIDGVTGGEKEGPMEPTPKKAQAIIASDSAVLADIFASTLMGFDPFKIPAIKYALMIKKKYFLLNISGQQPSIITPQGQLDLTAFSMKYHKHFEPSTGWKTKIERSPRSVVKFKQSL